MEHKIEMSATTRIKSRTALPPLIQIREKINRIKQCNCNKGDLQKDTH